MQLSFIFLQFLPIIVFIIVDSFVKNIAYSIAAAIAFAAVQTAITYYQTKVIDYFIFADLLLILFMGLISIWTKNEQFFKVKPAVIEGICILFLLFLILASDKFLIGYFSRYMPGYSVNSVVIPMLKKTLMITVIYLALHISAVLYTAFFSSKKVWAVVSGPGLYFIFIPVMFFVLYSRVKSKRLKIEEVGNERKNYI